MPLRRRYRAMDDDRFNRLIVERSPAGLKAEAMPPIDVQDCYLDTATGTLLAAGLLLRLRKRNDDVYASLRVLEAEVADELARARYRGDEVDLLGGLPQDDFSRAVAHFAGGGELTTLLRFRQYRTPRALFRRERLVGVLALDVVADQTDAGKPSVTNEVELELLDEADEDLLSAVETMLRDLGVEPDPYSKFEHGIFRLGARPEGRLLLLPPERERLETLSRSDSEVERRRARSLLLRAAGESEEDVSREVGLSPSRVRHWIETFRTERMAMFDPEIPAPVAPRETLTEPGYRVSALIGDAVRVKAGDQEGSTVDAVVDRVRREFETARAGADGEPAGVATGDPAGTGFGGSIGEFVHPQTARHAGLEYSAQTWAEDGLRGAAAEVQRLVQSIEEGKYENVAHRALGVCRLVSSVCTLTPLRARSDVQGLLEDALVFSGVLREWAVLHWTLRLLHRSESSDQPPQVHLGRALARSVWTVEEQRLVHGHDDRPALVDLARAFASTLRTVSGRLHDDEGMQLDHALASEVWQRFEDARRLLERPAGQRQPLDEAAAVHALAHLLTVLPGEPAAEAHRVARVLADDLSQQALCEAVANRVAAAGAEWIQAGGLSDPAVLEPLRTSATTAARSHAADAARAADVLRSRDFKLLLGWATAAI